MKKVIVVSVLAAMFALAGCTSQSASVAAPQFLVQTSISDTADMLAADDGTTPSPTPFTPVYRPQGNMANYGNPYPWALRVGIGLAVPDAMTLQASGRVDFALVSYQGPYSLEVGAGFYQFTDDDLGGHVTVVPMTLGTKVWMEPYPGAGTIKAYIGLNVGPYLVNHSNPIVEYSSTVGVDICTGLYLETQDHMFGLGTELSYTVNQPSITIGGIPGDENLNCFSWKATLDLIF